MTKKAGLDLVRNLAAGVALVFAGYPLSASADVIQFSWNLTGNASPTVHERTFTSTQILPSDPTSILKARAYATGNTDGSGNIVARNLGLYSGGLGVSGGDDSTSSPNHALDNLGRNDMILFEFDGVFNPRSVTVGWKQGDADISVWIGGPSTAGLNLTTACGGACDMGDLAGLGFSTPSLNYLDLTVNVPRSLNTALTGRYLLLAAQFEGGDIPGGDDDYMKVSTLVGKTGSKVPEPAAAGLLLLGVAALGWSRRSRKPGAARAS